MKKILLLLCMLLNGIPAFVQIPFLRIVPDTTLSTATSAVVSADVVVVQSEHKIFGVSISQNKTLWQTRIPYWGYAGSLSLSQTPDQVFLHALKDGPTQTEIIYTLNTQTGVMVDSIETKGITMINLYPVPGNPHEVGFIGQVKGKFSSAILHTTTGQITQTFFKEGDAGNTVPNAMAFSADGKSVAVVLINDKYEIRVYSVETGKMNYSFATNGAEIHDLEFSGDGAYLYFPDGRGNFHLLNTSTRVIEQSINTGARHGYMALSKNNEWVILSGWEGAPIVRVYLKTGEVEKSNYAANSFSCNADELGKYAVVTGKGMGSYFITRYPYCVLYPISPQTDVNQTDPITNPTLGSSNFKKGDLVQVEWNGSWYKARVLEINQDTYKIHYEGYGDEWNEWVTATRIKK
jgi:hypothetical protein